MVVLQCNSTSKFESKIIAAYKKETSNMINCFAKKPHKVDKNSENFLQLKADKKEKRRTKKKYYICLTQKSVANNTNNQLKAQQLLK